MTGHRLLEVDRDGYPSWLPDGDRALISQLQKGGIIQPNATVVKDSSGEYKSVSEGINSYPKNYQGRYIIYVKAGIYQEYVVVDERKDNILFYGDGPTRTIITGSKNQHEGITMPETATFGMLTINLSLVFPYFKIIMEMGERERELIDFFHQSSLFGYILVCLLEILFTREWEILFSINLICLN